MDPTKTKIFSFWKMGLLRYHGGLLVGIIRQSRGTISIHIVSVSWNSTWGHWPPPTNRCQAFSEPKSLIPNGAPSWLVTTGMNGWQAGINAYRKSWPLLHGLRSTSWLILNSNSNLLVLYVGTGVLPWIAATAWEQLWSDTSSTPNTAWLVLPQFYFPMMKRVWNFVNHASVFW